MIHGGLNGMRVLVTGGSGVIGKELLRQLVDRGADVLSADRVPLPQEGFEKVRGRMIHLDSEDLAGLTDFQPQAIFHLAASFERSRETPEFFEENWRDNVVVTHRMANMSRHLKSLQLFVFASSYLVYSPSLYMFDAPRSSATSLREDDLKSPRNLCGAAKYYGEKEIDHIRDLFNPALRTVHARIYRVYGRGSNDVVSRWVRAMMAGEDIELYNGLNQFDYIHARTVAEGLVRMAEHPEATGPLSLGTGNARRVCDLLEILKETLGYDENRITDQGAVESFEASCADVKRLRETIGWAPGMQLEQGIRDIIEYEKSRKV
jgi:nucleoside-diphosphate-sugar epimerase